MSSSTADRDATTEGVPDTSTAALVERLRAHAATQNELGRLFARRHGMHATDAAAVVEVLTAEQQDRPLTPARLAERLLLTTGATSTLLNRLEDAGHVTRSRQHRDRRVVTIRSTPAVHEAAEAFFAPLAQRLDAVLADRSPAELALVVEIVDALRSATADHLDAVDPTRPGSAASPQQGQHR